jgi:hypothetical protein
VPTGPAAGVGSGSPRVEVVALRGEATKVSFDFVGANAEIIGRWDASEGDEGWETANCLHAAVSFHRRTESTAATLLSSVAERGERGEWSERGE